MVVIVIRALPMQHLELPMLFSTSIASIHHVVDSSNISQGHIQSELPMPRPGVKYCRSVILLLCHDACNVVEIKIFYTQIVS